MEVIEIGGSVVRWCPDEPLRQQNGVRVEIDAEEQVR
jgi:hypothetical protein